MRFKLDENFGQRTREEFAAHSHDVQTVADEGLSGISDQQLFETCMAEERCLVSLDLDFADVVRFPPHRTKGIAVVRLPRGVTLDLLRRLVANLLDALTREPIEGRLWIVEVGRIRIHGEMETRIEGDSSESRL